MTMHQIELKVAAFIEAQFKYDEYSQFTNEMAMAVAGVMTTLYGFQNSGYTIIIQGEGKPKEQKGFIADKPQVRNYIGGAKSNKGTKGWKVVVE